ncbi:MAG: hypothetical protein FJ213_07205 [Ignavibacteria bacterium]|nr:hypothetical protein [Ignavibacteria bacterium]
MKGLIDLNKILIVLVIVSMPILHSACEDEGVKVDDVIIPSSNVSYAEHIQPVFNSKCALSGCHDDASKQGGLGLTTWLNTTSNFLVVFPGNPDASKLVLAVEGKTTNPMPPPGRWPLTKNQITAIRTWVKEGAKNN